MADQQRISGAHVAASKIGQLIGEVIIHHAPWTADISESTRRRVTDEWLERLESHGTDVFSDLIDQMINQGGPSPEILKLLEHAARPTAQFGSTIQQFFIYGVMFSLASTALAPFTQIVANQLWQANPTRPVSPPDIATMVVRGIAPGDEATTPAPDWALNMAAQSGISPENFQALVDATGNPPAPQDLFQMIRRNIITEDQLEQGIREGDTRDEWIPYISQLRYVQPSPLDMVRAAVQSQMTYEQAAQWAETLGLEPAGYLDGNPDWFRLLYDVYGRPPGPQELGHAALRGFIPWEGTGAEALTFEQGISESDIKDKWIPVLKQLMQYFPPPGETSRLLMHGGITPEQAIQLWQQAGIPPDIANAYAHVAQIEQVTQDKALAKGDVLTLVQEGALDDDTAISLLSQIGYTGENATFLVQMAHFRYNLEALRRAIGQVTSLYTGHKISATEAQTAFASLGMPRAQIDSLLAMLTIQRQSEVIVPTASEVADGLYYNIIDQATAMALLEQLGYQPWDAWLKLSVRNHAPLPDEPPKPPGI